MALVPVTKEEFFARINPLNVHPRSERDTTYWEMPNRELIGTSSGYMHKSWESPEQFFLVRKG